MKSTIFLIFILFWSFCDCREWEIRLEQELSVLNENYFDQEIYEDVTKLDVRMKDWIYQNKTESMSFDFLEKFPHLEEIIMYYVKFNAFKELKFVKNLKKLRFTYNGFKDVRKYHLEHLENLERIGLIMNKIEVLCQDLLQYNKKLKYVDFGINEIRSIPQDIFKGLYDLEEVKLNGNQLKDLPALLFQDNEKLRNVYLHFNKFFKVNPEVFTGLKLEILFIHGNRCGAKKKFRDVEVQSMKKCYDNWRESGPSADSSDGGKYF